MAVRAPFCGKQAGGSPGNTPGGSNLIGGIAKAPHSSHGTLMKNDRGGLRETSRGYSLRV
jgi:hypothetical protein